jgi:alkylated DNA repair dioxygenase AlkB
MYKIYLFNEWRNFLTISNDDFTKLVRNFDWKRGIPGGWLVYGPPRCVTAYGDGSLYSDQGYAYEKLYNYTAWNASTPASNCTAVSKTAPLPKAFIRSGIMQAIRHLLRQNDVMVNDSTCTGMWCNYYNQVSDYISPHTDNEDYYSRNYNQDTIFVSLTLYEDELFEYIDLARFQIKKNKSWNDIELPHLSLLIMAGACEHRVVKSKEGFFRPRYNITFRTPVDYKQDIVKNFRFFSNFGRYYRQTELLFVPEKAFEKIPPLNTKLYYKGGIVAVSKEGKRYKISTKKNNTSTVIFRYSEFSPITLQLNDIDISRKDILERLNVKSAPSTSTTQSLNILLSQYNTKLRNEN